MQYISVLTDKYYHPKAYVCYVFVYFARIMELMNTLVNLMLAPLQVMIIA